MSSLVSLQEALQSHLLVEDECIADQLIKPIKGILDDRLAVYADAYYLRLIDALQKEYPLLVKYLGEEAFEALSEVYIDEYPSRFYSINDFTKQLPDFLAVYQSKEAYLSELAALMRALSLSLESADASFLHPSALSEIPMQHWPSLCFKTHPSVQCLTFHWNTFYFWKALVQKTALPKLSKESSYCIVWRKELQSYANSLTQAECVVFQAFQAGNCFADVCEAVYADGLSSEAEAATLVANCLTRGLQDHLFSEVYIL
ncbi:MAG: DNA-binding domain-containing protein [Pseudomonadota bacterium]